MLMDGIEPPSSRRNGDYGDALPLSYVSIIQKCLHPLIVFEFCYSLHLCITITACDKKILCNYERGAFISYHSLVCRDKAERWIQTTLLPHKTDCVPILVLSKQCDPFTLLYHDVKCTGEEGGHLDGLLSS